MKRLNWIAAALIVLLLLGGYVGAYFGLSEYGRYFINVELPHRVFSNETTATIFGPLVAIESTLRGVEIESWVRDDLDGFEPFERMRRAVPSTQD